MTSICFTHTHTMLPSALRDIMASNYTQSPRTMLNDYLLNARNEIKKHQTFERFLSARSELVNSLIKEQNLPVYRASLWPSLISPETQHEDLKNHIGEVLIILELSMLIDGKKI